MKYDTRISGWGECALEFLNEDCNFLIIFNETAPQELADISVLHTVAMLQEEPCVGDTVQICDLSYTITAIGFEALHTLKELDIAVYPFPKYTGTASGEYRAERTCIHRKSPLQRRTASNSVKDHIEFQREREQPTYVQALFHMGSDKDIK